jgi:hypothetical protein
MLSQNCKKRQLAFSCLLVCPSARNNLVPTGRIFIKLDIFDYFFKKVIKIQVLLNCNGTLFEDVRTLRLRVYLAQFF